MGLQVHGAVVAGRVAAAHVRGATCGNSREGEEYARAYYEHIVEMVSDANEDETWDRNP